MVAPRSSKETKKQEDGGSAATDGGGSAITAVLLMKASLIWRPANFYASLPTRAGEAIHPGRAVWLGLFMDLVRLILLPVIRDSCKLLKPAPIFISSKPLRTVSPLMIGMNRIQHIPLKARQLLSPGHS